ncbi:hypothetical protein LTR66_007061 [Elasticomyces elasticus]|nr:hypothetical protein LTR66_007061 [Elasticomyces elasticus]KAK4989817.1 hypothetical protein LTR50_002992 [Elasticomyces elasticus]
MASPIFLSRSLVQLCRKTTCSTPPKRLRTQPWGRSIATYTSPYQAAQISVLRSEVDTSSRTFKDNAKQMGELTWRMAELHEKITEGGPQKARDKHIARGKMLVRDRITALIDPGTSFLELSALAGHDVYPGEDVPAGGIVTGIGTIEGVMSMIVANDSTYVPSGLLLISAAD